MSRTKNINIDAKTVFIHSSDYGLRLQLRSLAFPIQISAYATGLNQLSCSVFSFKVITM